MVSQIFLASCRLWWCKYKIRYKRQILHWYMSTVANTICRTFCVALFILIPKWLRMIYLLLFIEVASMKRQHDCPYASEMPLKYMQFSHYLTKPNKNGMHITASYICFCNFIHTDSISINIRLAHIRGLAQSFRIIHEAKAGGWGRLFWLRI